MEAKKSMKNLFQKPVLVDTPYTRLKDNLIGLLLTLISLAIPWVGFPIAVVIKDERPTRAKVLLIASSIGLVLWIIMMIYGWGVYKDSIPRDPNVY